MSTTVKVLASIQPGELVSAWLISKRTGIPRDRTTAALLTLRRVGQLERVSAGEYRLVEDAPPLSHAMAGYPAKVAAPAGVVESAIASRPAIQQFWGAANA